MVQIIHRRALLLRLAVTYVVQENTMTKKVRQEVAANGAQTGMEKTHKLVKLRQGLQHHTMISMTVFQAQFYPT